MVGQLVPAGELPIWEAHFEREPWGFHATDQLLSKAALHIAQATGSVKEGVTVQDFMYSDAFDALKLTDPEIEKLSEAERANYLHRRLIKRFNELSLTQEDFEKLNDNDQRNYAERHAAQIKKVFG